MGMPIKEAIEILNTYKAEWRCPQMQGGILTADYNPNRYTIAFDANGIVNEVQMG
jgi:hypothetical protein